MDHGFIQSLLVMAKAMESWPSARWLQKHQGALPDGVILRLRQSADTPDLFDLFNEPSFLDKASTQGPFAALNDFEAWLDGLAPAGKYEIVAQAGTRVVAFGGLYAFPELMSHCGSLILGVREDWQKRKIGSSILHMLLLTAEIMAGLSKIHLTVFTHNIAAVRMYSEFGFEVEGLLRHFTRRGDGFADAYSMALFFDQSNRAKKSGSAAKEKADEAESFFRVRPVCRQN